jgi:hypothetical protein
MIGDGPLKMGQTNKKMLGAKPNMVLQSQKIPQN